MEDLDAKSPSEGVDDEAAAQKLLVQQLLR
jgi:hypothetical protein